jgi:glutaryl-CoA dehydrogenase
MNEFRGVDFYKTDTLLSDSERRIRNEVRTWVSERAEPIMAGHFETATFPGHLIPEMAELGLFGSTLPARYGCRGMNYVSYGLAMQELERGDSSLRSFASVQGALTMQAIFLYGSEEQKRFWLPKLARGEAIGCFGLTEPDAGSDPANLQAEAAMRGKRWFLNGTKSWITNATMADIAVVWAKAGGEIRGFLVEKGAKGFTSGEIATKVPLRSSNTGWLAFKDCAVSEKDILPESKGLVSPLKCLTLARYGIAWGALGAAMACYQAALDYSKKRIQFNRPLAGFQLVQQKLVHMLTEITKGQLLCLQLGRLQDSGNHDYARTSLAKRNNVDMALETARLARDILGANGITLGFPVIRHMCNLEAVKTYEGTHDIHTLILGETITGLPAFR